MTTAIFTKALGLLATGATFLAFSLDLPVANAAIIAVGDGGSWSMGGANTLSSQGFTMQKVFENPSIPEFNDLSSLESPLGSIQLTPTVNKRIVGSSWLTWRSQDPIEVYWTGTGVSNLTITPLFAMGAFDLYAQPDQFGTFTISVTVQNDGVKTTLDQLVSGTGGARYFGFYTTTPGEQITEITITTTDEANGFAIGELRLASPIPIPSPALLPGLVGLSIGIWRKRQGTREMGSGE